MNQLIHIVKKTIIDNKLVCYGDNLIIAVSGGIDSMGLLYVFAGLKKELNLGLTAVYIDHGLRPDETPEEIRLIRKSAAALKIPCEVNHVAVKEYAQDNKISIEHAARELRYKSLRKTAFKKGGSNIAVAHTSDDQVEQILLKLFKGSGMKGLSGMRFKYKDIIRPFLNIDKYQIVEFLDNSEIKHCEDSSNLDLSFSRNRVRHKILPYLEKTFDKGIRESLLKTGSILTQDEQYLNEATNKAWTDFVNVEEKEGLLNIHIVKSDIKNLHTSIQRRLIEEILWRIGNSASYENIIHIIKMLNNGITGKELHLKQGLRVVLQKKKLLFFYPKGKKTWRGSLKSIKKSF